MKPLSTRNRKTPSTKSQKTPSTKSEKTPPKQGPKTPSTKRSTTPSTKSSTKSTEKNGGDEILVTRHYHLLNQNIKKEDGHATPRYNVTEQYVNPVKTSSHDPYEVCISI
jgi:hypothetical protein